LIDDEEDDDGGVVGHRRWKGERSAVRGEEEREVHGEGCERERETW